MNAADLPEVADGELMLKVRSGDEDAFRGLFARYSPNAKALAMRVVKRSHLAEEIVQEVFLALWKDPQSYDANRGSVKTWLMGMVHHRAVDLVRREESQRRRAQEAGRKVVEIEDDPAEQIVIALGAPEERRAVREALATIPEEQRDVLEMMYFDGLSQSQVADKTGLPLGTVKSRTLLGMRRLRTSLAALER